MKHSDLAVCDHDGCHDPRKCDKPTDRKLNPKEETMTKKATKKEIRKIVRTYSAGVFFGNIKSRKGKEVVMTNARRIWRWDGAASLSELAQRGTSKPSSCQFPCAVDEVILTEAVEILSVTPTAAATIDSVPLWTR